MQMQDIVKTQMIHSVQIHINSSHLFAFYNTYYIQCLKRFVKGIKLDIIEHNHPLHYASQLPFAIVNATYIIPQPKLQSLLQAISNERPVRLLFFKPVLQLCEQLSAVGRYLSQQPKNPYYLLLSPLKKYEVYKWNSQFKKNIFLKTQYFNPYTQQLNKQHLIYKINTLADYVSKIDRNTMVIICVFSMMKSLRVNNMQLYNTFIKNQTLKNLEQEGYRLISQQIPKQMAQQFRFIGTYQDEAEKKDQPQNTVSQPIFSNNIAEFMSRVSIPIVAFTIFWKVHRVLAGPFKS